MNLIAKKTIAFLCVALFQVGFIYAQKTQSISIKPEWELPGTQLKHTWAGIGNVDQTRWMIRGDMQDQLAMCNKEIGLKMVRAVGVFDDEMRVVAKNPANWLDKTKRNDNRLNFRVPLYVYDELIKRGIYPIVTTNFTPTALSSGTKTTFETKSNVSPPKDYEEFGRLVSDFVKVLENRYGVETVRKFYFEVWNEPNLPNFWDGNQLQYFDLYKVVYKAIKSVDKDLKVGGPSTARAEWIKEFIDYGRANNCEPDYIIGHCYNNDNAVKPLSPFDGPQKDLESNSPSFTAGVIRGVHKLLKDLNYTGEIHFNEWGLSWHPYNLVRETPNEAAFIVKTMNEVSQYADYFAYWCLSDIYDQVGYGKEAFHGNYGMISLDGLKKPNYFAHQLLCRLGDTQVAVKGDNLSELTNAFVSKSKTGVQAIVYDFNINYRVDSAVYRKNVEVFFPASIDPKSAVLIRLDSKHNNIKPLWEKIGSPDYPTAKELEYLKNNNKLTPSVNELKIIKVKSGYKVSFDIETTSTAMIEFKNKK